MSVNILELINTAVGDQLLSKIAALVGEDEQRTVIAFRSAVPAILGGLVKKSESLDGAELVFRSLTGFNGGVLQNFESIISGGELDNFSKIGTGVSQAVFGSEYDAAIGAVARYSGVNPLASATLLGLATPVVLGVLGHEKETSNLDREGVANFLEGQKLHLVQATPHDLLESIGLGEFFRARSDAASPATGPPVAATAVEATGTAVIPAASATADEPGNRTPRTKSSGLLKVLVPLLLIGALGFGGWQFLQGRKSAELVGQDSISAPMETSLETVADLDSDQMDASDLVDETVPTDDFAANAAEITDELQADDEQPTQFVTDNSGTSELEPAAENHVEETLSAGVEQTPWTQIEDQFSTEIETPVDAVADSDQQISTETPAVAEPAGTASVDTNSHESAVPDFSEVTSSPQTATSDVVLEPVAESIPVPANLGLTDELGFEPVDSEASPVAQIWQPQEANHNTRNVANDASPDGSQFVQPAAPLVTDPAIPSEPVDPAIQPGPQVITGEPYEGAVIETRPAYGVIETYRPQQAYQPRVIQGQPYQGGVVYNAVPSQPRTQGGAIQNQPSQQPYSLPQGLQPQPIPPATQYYQGQYYELAPYQQPLFNGRIIRRFFPLFN